MLSALTNLGAFAVNASLIWLVISYKRYTYGRRAPNKTITQKRTRRLEWYGVYGGKHVDRGLWIRRPHATTPLWTGWMLLPRRNLAQALQEARQRTIPPEPQLLPRRRKSDLRLAAVRGESRPWLTVS